MITSDLNVPDDDMPEGFEGLPVAVDSVLEDLERQRDRWQAHAESWEDVARLLAVGNMDLFRALCAGRHLTP